MPTEQPTSDFAEIKNANQRAFLAAFVECGTVTNAAKAAKISRRSHVKWMHKDPDYPAAFAVAKELACDTLEAEARRRAEGCRRYKFTGKGEPVIDPRTGEQYYEDEKSDVLIMFLLNGNNPGKFKHRQEITGANDGPVTFTLDIGTPNGDTV